VLTDESRYSIDGALTDHGAGRTDIWQDYVQPQAIKKYFLTGVGFGRTMEAIKETYTYDLKCTHNNYLEVFVNYGIFGIVLFFFAIVQIWKNIRVPAIFGLYTMWLIVGCFLDTFVIRETYIVLGVICCNTKYMDQKLDQKRLSGF
jgi:O-antigen ligase